MIIHMLDIFLIICDSTDKWVDLDGVEFCKLLDIEKISGTHK